MRISILVIMAGLVCMLSSCASTNDAAINESFDTMAINFDDNQTAQVDSKVTAIKDIMEYECADNSTDCGAAKAFSKMAAAGFVAKVEPQEFKRKRGVTGVDAQIKLVDKTEAIVTGITTLGVVKLVTDAGPSVEYKNAGDVQNSGNNTEAHTTTMGDENAGQSSTTEKDKEVPIMEALEEESETTEE